MNGSLPFVSPVTARTYTRIIISCFEPRSKEWPPNNARLPLQQVKSRTLTPVWEQELVLPRMPKSIVIEVCGIE